MAVEILERESGGRVDKFVERRRELAQAAVQTLAELGYARTSLREIAQNSAFSHGVLHYYFKDKADLIMCCVRHYKAHCVTRYDVVSETSRTPTALIDGFAESLAASLREEAQLHRLWYDLRAQAMFEPAFRADIAEIDGNLQAMIWRVMARYFALAAAEPSITPSLAYAMFDGLFQQALLKYLSGEARAVDDMQADVRLLFARILPCGPHIAGAAS
ncbi:MAG TPA: TetR/AcrR family transcriptional regulator [Acetobacteraceae bacterium]|nr:TetR/AcrR family transcriptional regulator [Acetobacteraceae bacterium]